MVNGPGVIGVAVLFGLLFVLRLGRFRRIRSRRETARNTPTRRSRTPLARRLGRALARRRR